MDVYNWTIIYKCLWLPEDIMDDLMLIPSILDDLIVDDYTVIFWMIQNYDGSLRAHYSLVSLSPSVKPLGHLPWGHFLEILVRDVASLLFTQGSGIFDQKWFVTGSSWSHGGTPNHPVVVDDDLLLKPIVTLRTPRDNLVYGRRYVLSKHSTADCSAHLGT